MKLQPLLNFSNFNLSPQQKKQNSTVNFAARKDYEELEKNYTVRASSLFRRGDIYGSYNDNYRDIENTLKYLYSQNKVNKILVVGVGEAQEPLSLAASAYSINYFDNLKDVLDMHCVDLGPKLTDEDVTQSARLYRDVNKFACDSTTTTENGIMFKDEIQDFVKQTLNSEEKTKWNTSVQEYLKTCPKNEYDCVSINNVLGYISAEEHESLIRELGSIVKPNGTFITDPYLNGFIVRKNLLPEFKEMYQGIYRKDKQKTPPKMSNMEQMWQQTGINNMAMIKSKKS